MHFTTTRSAFVAALLLSPAWVAPPRPAPCADPSTDPAVCTRIVDEGTRNSQVMEHLDALVNGIGPRLTGSTNLAKACAWSAETFRSYGLDARLEKWGDAAVGFDRGVQKGALVAPVREDLTFISYAWTPGTGGPRRARAVAGPASMEEFTAMKAQLAGRYVLLTLEARTNADLRKVFDDTADELKIAGLITPSRSDELLVMSGQMPQTPEELGKFTRISLLAPQFKALQARLLAGEVVELEFDIDNRVVPGPVELDNVVADLRGSELPDEYVILGGHIDSWDGATGATDNGTGCATTLEAARLLTAAGAHPRRTIRFMLWSGEEQGLLGSAAWVKAHPDVLPHISAVLVHDGGTDYLSGLGVTHAQLPQAQAALQPVLDWVATAGDNMPFTLHEVPGLSVMGDSDHASFTAGGAPGFFWDQAGGTDYDHTHHTQFDTYDAANAAYQKHSAIVAALAALGLADAPELLSREKLIAPNAGRRRLGIMPGDDGVSIRTVAPNLQAEKNGMLAGDKLLSVNGEPVVAGALQELLRKGEGRKVVAWKHGDATRQAVFAWEPAPDAAREPELVTLQTADGVTLQADYLMGSTEGPARESALVLLPMNRSDRASWAPVRDALCRAGIASLALDLRGMGQSVDAAGTLAARVAAGDPALYNAMDKDAAAAVAWLESRAYSPTRIGLMGASVGCSVALRAAVQDPRLAGVAALSPGRDYLGVDSLADLQHWDLRPLLLVSGRDEETSTGHCEAMRVAALAHDPWTPVQVLLLPGSNIHGTSMFGAVPGIEQQLADWWAARLR